MPSVNWETTATNLPIAGKYVFEVKNVVESISKNSGDPYFSVEFSMLKRPDVLLTDVLSFSDKALPITKRKLKTLGFAGKGNIEASELLGKRVGLAVKHEENFYGDIELRVDISANASSAGYFELVVPGGVAQPESVQKPKYSVENDFDDDIQF